MTQLLAMVMKAATKAVLTGVAMGMLASPAQVQAEAKAPVAPVPAASFATVDAAKPIKYPRDAGAHPGFRTEWWYVTGWLTPTTQTGDKTEAKPEPLGFQITFFRSATGHDANDPSAFAPTQLIIAHAGLSDPRLGRLVHDQRIARQGFDLAYAKTDTTDVKLDDWHFIRQVDGQYKADIRAHGFTLQLTFSPSQAVLLQGDHGYSRKGPLPDQASYYYSEPQLKVSGHISRDGTTGQSPTAPLETAVTGQAWLDHEWSSTALSADATGWDWLGANLDDGGAIMAFTVRGRQGETVWRHAVMRDAAGNTQNIDAANIRFTPRRWWVSPHSATRYPVSQDLQLGSSPASRWQLIPLFDDQEMDARASSNALYWEGAIKLVRDGQTVGHGYLELTGYGKAIDLNQSKGPVTQVR